MILVLALVVAAILTATLVGFAVGDRRHCAHRHPEGKPCNPDCEHGTRCPERSAR